jgi:hypothetical protein
LNLKCNCDIPAFLKVFGFQTQLGPLRRGASRSGGSGSGGGGGGGGGFGLGGGEGDGPGRNNTFSFRGVRFEKSGGLYKLYKLNEVNPELESAWFQLLEPMQ